MLAGLYAEVKSEGLAERFMRRAVATSVDFPARDRLVILLTAAELALKLDLPDDAKDYADRALTLDPVSMKAKRLRVMALRMLKDLDVAEEELEKMLIDSPTSFAIRDQLAQVLAEQNDKTKRQQAIDFARINYKLSRGDPDRARESAVTLAWVLYNMNNVNEAERIMKSIGELDSGDGIFYRALIAVDSGRSGEAFNDLEVALSSGQPFIHRSDAKAAHTILKRRRAAN